MFLHKGSGQFVQKQQGRFYYLGKDRERAERRLSGLLVSDLIDEFMAHKRLLLKAGELVERTIADYETVFKRVREHFGDKCVEELQPGDFAELRAAFAQTHGPHALLGDIARTRALFNFGGKQHGQFPHVGVGFSVPSKRTLRLAARGKELCVNDILSVVQSASETFRSMVLLGLSCGYGNTDVSTVKGWHVSDGWVCLSRSKTGIERRAPLWPEITIPEQGFRTSKGKSWRRRKHGCPVSHEFARLMRKAGVHKNGVGFYSLRRMFLTLGEEVDPIAAKVMMGHCFTDVTSGYRQYVDDARLRLVSERIRLWLGPLTEVSIICSMVLSETLF